MGGALAYRRPARRHARLLLATGLVLVAASLGITPVRSVGATPDLAQAMVTAAPTDAQITNFGYGLTNPGGITTGPDGNLWFLERGSSSSTSRWISRSTPSGVISHLPEVGFALGDGIVTGPDGNVWFGGAGTIARMTPSGEMTAFADPGIGFVQDITVGPDGALWFVDQADDRIGRVTTSGSITSFPAADIDTPHSIVTGIDGNLWFGSSSTARIGRMSPAGASTSYPLGVNDRATSLANGPDGNIWFVGGGAIGKATMGGVATTLTRSNDNPTDIVVGSDGNLWIALAFGPDRLARITTAGVLTRLALSTGGPGVQQIHDLVSGPGGALWFTTGFSNTIGSVTLAGVATVHRGIPVDRPASIVASPDGDLVFANVDGDSIGRVSTTGTITEVVARNPDGTNKTLYSPDRVVIGADEAIWFPQYGQLLRMAVDGTVTSYATLPGAITGLTVGPDGWLWFTVFLQGNPFDPWTYPSKFTVARMSPLGDVQTITTSDTAGPSSIITGPDGNLWVIKGKELGRITPAGAVLWFAPADVTRIEQLTAGPDGNVWFTTGTDGSIGRITPDGVTTLFPTGTLTPRAISPGPDGNLWFTNGLSDSIGRITPAGVVSAITDDTVDLATSIAAGPDGALYFTDQGNNSIGRVTLAPAAPTQVVVSAGTAAAMVSWTAGATGGAPISGYVATASPGGLTCSTTGALACTLRGLVPGTAYTVTVTATNAIGSSAASAPSAPVTPGRGAGYHALTPARVLDSRTPVGAWSGSLVAGAPRDLQLAGAGGVPPTAAAAVMNVTATGASANSFVTAWPAGEMQPTASNLNFAAGETIPNLVTVKLGASGEVSFANAVGAVDLVADVVGYYDDGIGSGDLFTGITPTRLLDSRGPTGGWRAPLAAGAPRDLLVRQPNRAAGVPASATAVVVNVTATGATEPSFLSVWPAGVAPPGVSNLNFGAGQTIPNLAVVKVGDNDSIRFANAAGAVDVVVDVVAYFDPTAGSRFHAITPTRVLDDRVGTGLSGPWGPGESRALVVAGAAGSNVAADASGVVLNVTATGATEGSFVTVYPQGVNLPASSNLNFGTGQTIPNLVMTGVGSGAAVAFFNANGSVDLIADAVGYFSPS